MALLAALLCFLPSTSLAAENTLYRHELLIIHSYHKDMEWVEQIMEGVDLALAEKRSVIDLKVEYMDSKRFVGDEYFNLLTAVWKHKYGSDPPDCIIVCDDNALNLLLAVREEIFPGVPVVFCGINHYDEQRFQAYSNLTGVIEEYDLPGTLDIIKNLFPERRTLFIINDDTATGRANKARLEALAYDYTRHFRFIYSGSATVADLTSSVDSLGEETAILLMSFNRDAEGKSLRYRDAIRLVHSNASVPVFGVWSFYLGAGLFGGSLVNGTSQGQTAAELAITILQGTAPDALPVIRQSPNTPMFDQTELDRFHISRNLLPKNSVIVNTPDTLWFRHKYKILAGLAIMAIQGILILLLVSNARRRQASEQQLIRTRNDLSTTLRSLGDAVVSMDGDFRITQVNLAAERMFDMVSDQLVGRVFPEVMAELDPTGGIALGENVLACYKFGEKVDIADDATLQVAGRPSMYIQGSCSPIRNGTERPAGVVLIIHDITERKSMQTMLAQSRRLEAIGQLAGGVAHDFNNLLAGISGYAEMLALQLKDNEKLQTNAVRIQQASQRAAELTKQLLSFARKGKVISSPIDCHTILRSVIGLLERTIDRSIVIRSDFAAEWPVIIGDPTQLENIFLNLGINGADAMPDGGELSFQTKNTELTETLPCEFGERLDPGLYLCVSVRDTGQGIRPEHYQKIFEPFYTTKEAGKGTGLGLAAVYGAVKEHGGGLTLTSEVGCGTDFELYFPAEQLGKIETGGKAEEAQGHETLLIIDDEQLILTSAGGLLSELGYTVFTARGGEQGLRTYERNKADIDLVLLDMIMPEMDGMECFRRLRNINPDVKVVICSGFTKTGRFKNIEELGAFGFLQKPFTAAEVTAIIKEVCRT